jgi:hypothetical protein
MIPSFYTLIKIGLIMPKWLSHCKYCHIELTKLNRYGKNCCTKSECKRKLLEVCDGSCFTCTYADCIVNPSKLVGL